MPDVRIVKDSADDLTEQICSRMALNTGVFSGRNVIADMPKCHKCECDLGRFFQCSSHHSQHTAIMTLNHARDKHFRTI